MAEAGRTPGFMQEGSGAAPDSDEINAKSGEIYYELVRSFGVRERKEGDLARP